MADRDNAKQLPSTTMRRVSGRTLQILLACSGVALLVVVMGRSRVTSSDPPVGQPANAREHLSEFLGEADSQSYSGTRTPTSAPAHDGSPLDPVDECLAEVSDGATMLECLMTSTLCSVQAGEVGSWLCSSGWPIEKKGLVLQAAILCQDPTTVLSYLDGVYSTCSAYLETPLIEASLRGLRKIAPAWYDKAKRSLSPEMAFASVSEAPIQALHTFAEDADPYLASMLVYGAWGSLGGTAGQMHRAALAAASVVPGGETYVSLLEGILDSYSIPDSNDMGAFLVTFSLQEKALVEGRMDRALACISRALDDPRYRSQAAAQLLRYYDTVPPDGITQDAWNELREWAELILKTGL